MKLTMNHSEAVAIVDTEGWDAFLAHLDDLTGNRLDLYGVSQDWHRIGPEYIAKAKGAKGDVLVSWA